MYMIGQVATLLDARVSIEKLHGDVCHGAQQMLAPAAVEPHTETPSNVAIVGIGVVLPKANSAEDSWNKLLNQVRLIRDVQETTWDWKLFLHQHRWDERRDGKAWVNALEHWWLPYNVEKNTN